MGLQPRKDHAMNNNFFSNQMSKLKLEAVVKSLLLGLAVGFGAGFAAAATFWFAEFGSFWLALGIFAFVTVVAGILFYFCRFAPNDVRSARRLDGMGLYERMITMVEFQNDDSYMARIQREDAKSKLASIDRKQIKIKISKI
jgi:membrane protein implicated in regulation of membrane protease activity